ncbi:serine/threonine-protein phosphatase 2A 65 kDa regulatory subunit A alpha isoform-like [Schistocerca cancellata]|uniref:serine/threonine-protein phosphatase 2A 65 kDa regulatory subunit A alpha isoform-like n=1 Tax=Schistocerca cancellata TaxID=274614 RepID=UPI002118E635|nr:serine/threonine-protein phosphatase 2A 65 kDa regulatory subunit A alpha isoform-like [Schistocerca cancellata]
MLEKALSDNTDGCTWVNFSVFVPTFVLLPLQTSLEYNPTTEESDACDAAQCWKRETTPKIFRQYFEDRFVSLLSILTAEESIKSRILARTLLSFVRQIYYRLCVDESVAVRENAARKLDQFAKVVDLSHFKVDIIPLFHMLQKDEEVIIRVAAAESLVNILMYQRVSDELSKELLSELQKYINDPSSSVRYLIVIKIVEVLRGLQEGTLKSDLLHIHDGLLKTLTQEDCQQQHISIRCLKCDRLKITKDFFKDS